MVMLLNNLVWIVISFSLDLHFLKINRYLIVEVICLNDIMGLVLLKGQKSVLLMSVAFSMIQTSISSFFQDYFTDFMIFDIRTDLLAIIMTKDLNLCFLQYQSYFFMSYNNYRWPYKTKNDPFFLLQLLQAITLQILVIFNIIETILQTIKISQNYNNLEKLIIYILQKLKSFIIIEKKQIKIMLLTIFLIEAILYVFSAWLAYSQTKKILKKYAKYPHPQNLPQQWNGFIRQDKHKWDQTQILMGCFIRFPLKFLIFLQYVLVCFVIILITLPFGSKTCNKFLKYYGRYLGTFVFKLIYSISEPEGLRKKILKTPILISNHVCWFDTMYLIVTFYPISFLSKQQVRKIPIIGTITDNAQSIYIQRENQSSRNSIISKIQQRVKDFITHANGQKYQQVYPLIIFPQGTTSNGKSLLKFKLGAFNDRANLTVIALKYDCDNFDVGMVQITQLQHIILSFCLKVNLKVSMTQMQPNDSQTSQQYGKRAQKKISQIGQLRIYNSGFRERMQHKKLIQNLHNEQMNKNLQNEQKLKNNQQKQNSGIRQKLI